jgi:Spy/CpxP family protein refolding chaperone
MNRIRLLATGIVLMFALTVAAQTAPSGAEQNQSSAPSMSPVERHLKVLSEKLDLTSDQQDGVRPILQEMHDSMQKADQDASLSNDQRTDQVKTARMKADKRIREVLSDDQKKKLDQLEQGCILSCTRSETGFSDQCSTGEQGSGFRYDFASHPSLRSEWGTLGYAGTEKKQLPPLRAHVGRDDTMKLIA